MNILFNKVGSKQTAVSSMIRNCQLQPANCLLFIVLLFFSHLALAQKPVPELWGQRVHDDAHVLSTETVDELEKGLAAYQDSTSNQIAILTIQSLDGDVLEDYSMRVVEKWKLGQANKDNGVLLLVAVDDHKMRIEVGMGLEGVLTDATASRIIRNELAPNFRRDDYDAGIKAGIDGIIKAIGGEYAEDASAGGDSISDMPLNQKIIIGSVLFVFLGIFVTVGLFSKGNITWVLYVFMMPFYAAFMGLLISWYFFYGYLILYPLLRLLIVKSGVKLMENSSGGSGGSGWSSWSSGGGSSGGGSSFSGGGGSFGGGGSSGSW